MWTLSFFSPVKWATLSYLHVSWETAEDLVSKTSNGRRKMAKLAEGTEEELAIDDVADYTIVERILDCQVVTTEVDSATIGAGSGAGTVEMKWFRIKWQGELCCVYLCWWWRSLYVWVGMLTHPILMDAVFEGLSYLESTWEKDSDVNDDSLLVNYCNTNMLNLSDLSTVPRESCAGLNCNLLQSILSFFLHTVEHGNRLCPCPCAYPCRGEKEL